MQCAEADSEREGTARVPAKRGVVSGIEPDPERPRVLCDLLVVRDPAPGLDDLNVARCERHSLPARRAVVAVRAVESELDDLESLGRVESELILIEH